MAVNTLTMLYRQFFRLKQNDGYRLLEQVYLQYNLDGEDSGEDIISIAEHLGVKGGKVNCMY